MRANIQHARQAALSLLEPTESQLQQGMELHADALVCDIYGLGIHSATDGDAVRQAAQGHAPYAELRGLINETTRTGPIRSQALLEEYREAWKATGLTCIVQNAGEESQVPLTLMQRLARFNLMTDILRDEVTRAVGPRDILQAKAQQRHCIYPMTCGVPLPQRWQSVEDELELIRLFFQFGARMMHLTYNRRNMIGDGCGETPGAGLSDLGRAVVREMNRVGVIVDGAHSSWQTCIDAAEVSTRPILLSHTAAHALNPHCRCKTDEVLQAVADKGGVIGVCCHPDFLGRGRDINAFLDHIDHMVDKAGIDHVGIGTDRAYVSEYDAAERAKFKLPPSRARWEKLWPAGMKPGEVDADSSPSLELTNFPLFTVGLVQRGYSEEQIRKILGGNFMRVAQVVLADTLYQPATRTVTI